MKSYCVYTILIIKPFFRPHWDLLSGTYSLFWNWLFGKILCHAKLFPSFDWHWTHIETGLDLWNVQTILLGHFDSLFDGIVPSLARILTKQHGIRGGRGCRGYLLKTPENAISETLNFKMSLECHGPQELVPWCQFQSRLLFIIICLLLKTFWQPCSQVHVGFRCLYHCLLNSKKYSFLLSIDEIIFDFFFQV